MPKHYTVQPTIVDYHSTKKALASILLEQGKTYDEIHQATGLASETIAAIRYGRTEVSTQLAEALRKSEVEKLTLGIHSILDNAFKPENVVKMSTYQGVGSASILIEKRELLSGRATVRVGSDIPDQALSDRIAELERSIEARTIDIVPVSTVTNNGMTTTDAV